MTAAELVNPSAGLESESVAGPAAVPRERGLGRVAVEDDGRRVAPGAASTGRSSGRRCLRLSTRSTSWVSFGTLAMYDALALGVLEAPAPAWISSSIEESDSGCDVPSQRSAALSVGAGLVGEALWREGADLEGEADETPARCGLLAVVASRARPPR